MVSILLCLCLTQVNPSSRTCLSVSLCHLHREFSLFGARAYLCWHSLFAYWARTHPCCCYSSARQRCDDLAASYEGGSLLAFVCLLILRACIPLLAFVACHIIAYTSLLLLLHPRASVVMIWQHHMRAMVLGLFYKWFPFYFVFV